LVGILDFRILPVSSLTGSGCFLLEILFPEDHHQKATEQLSTFDIG
jgi:hypothetical protein